MSTTTSRLSLIKPDYVDAADIDTVNDNMDALDAAIGSLQDSIANAKALLGQLGVDSNDDPVVTKSVARTTLGVPADSGIATVETSPASAAHSVGEYITYNSTFYRVKAAISANDALVVGTNIEAASVGSAIKNLQDSVNKAPENRYYPQSGQLFSLVIPSTNPSQHQFNLYATSGGLFLWDNTANTSVWNISKSS